MALIEYTYTYIHTYIHRLSATNTRLLFVYKFAQAGLSWSYNAIHIFLYFTGRVLIICTRLWLNVSFSFFSAHIVLNDTTENPTGSDYENEAVVDENEYGPGRNGENAYDTRGDQIESGRNENETGEAGSGYVFEMSYFHNRCPDGFTRRDNMCVGESTHESHPKAVIP